MTRVDKPALLKRLFELGATASGQIVSYNEDCSDRFRTPVTPPRLARYLELAGQ